MLCHCDAWIQSLFPLSVTPLLLFEFRNTLDCCISVYFPNRIIFPAFHSTIFAVRKQKPIQLCGLISLGQLRKVTHFLSILSSSSFFANVFVSISCRLCLSESISTLPQAA